MKMKTAVIAPCCILPAIFLCWHLFTSGYAKWLHVQTPRFAVKGEEFRVRITLETPEPGLFLVADIHGMNGEKKSSGYLSGSGHVPVTAGKKVYDLSIPVPLTPDPSFIFLVVVLSRDGTWGGRISAADTGPIPVRASGGGDGLRQPVTQKTRDTEMHSPAAKPESPSLSIAISIAWLAAALTAVFTRQLFVPRLFAAAAAVSSVWEVLHSSSAAGNFLRLAAQGTGLYGVRRLPQQVLTAAIILGIALSALYIITSSRKLRNLLPWICIAVYWCITSLQIFSLHETDTLLNTDIAGIHTGQLLKLAAAVVCLGIFASGKKITAKD